MAKVKKGSTLRKQFIMRMLIVLLIISGISGAVHYYYLGKQIDENVINEATSIGHSIEQGIKETNTASEAIENQLDLKLKLIAQRISDRLGTKTVDEITNDELIKISKDFGITGVTIFARENDDVVGKKSTEPNDIGFSFKEMFGPEDSGFIGMNDLLNNKEPVQEDVSYVDHDTIILYSSQSGSHEDKPVFFKYAYYHKQGQEFIINPYIEANEVYKFTEEVGPNTWIKNVISTNKYSKEVAVLDPQVYADPELAEKMYPPLTKLVFGSFELEDKKDEQVLVKLADSPKRIAYTTPKGNEDVYKMFIPMDNGKVIYVALDYTLMSEPLKQLSTLLIAFSLLSLIGLFIVSARFFSSIYKNIQVIISQIKALEDGDFTTQSEVKEKGELADLSASANHMTDTLNGVLKDTTKQAEKVQSLSSDLKAEADESVEKVYAIAIDLTSNAREDAYEISDFLDSLKENLIALPQTEDIEKLLTRVEEVRTISNNRAESTTDITITLSDLMKSLQTQSVELSEISSILFENMYKFKL